MRRVLIINGPNLNMLGLRQPEIYGSDTLADIEAACREKAAALQLEIECFQSNIEGEIVTVIQQARGKFDAIVINPAAYSHTSVAILDALLAVDMPVVEVHLSNIHKRDEFRHFSYVSKAAAGVICGFGKQGYLLALEAVASLFK
ncbi:MAG: type II 3-dehydroquinate dehydratase [Alphaproteobacteria bacterium]|nr:type II 3-dehydroquinate dehydratase [Alphaproteobacteria bacterium]